MNSRVLLLAALAGVIGWFLIWVILGMFACEGGC